MAIDPWILWQLADSAFPAGGLNHSGGLEAVWQTGELDAGHSGGLEAFLRSHLIQQGAAMAPFAVAIAREPDRFADLDRLCDAMLSNHVTNRASRAQGRAVLTAARRIFVDSDSSDTLKRLPLRDDHGELPIHFATAFGAIGASLGIDGATVCRAFLFISMRAVVSAAVRVGIVGPFEGQGIQHALSGLAESVATQALQTRVEDAAATAPLIDVVQGMQDRLYSRLFVS